MIIIEAFNSAFNLSVIINYIGNIKGITFKLKLYKVWDRKITFEHFDLEKCFQNQRKSNSSLLSINDIVDIFFLIMQDQGSYSVIASIILPRFFNIIEQPYYIPYSPLIRSLVIRYDEIDIFFQHTTVIYLR